MTGFGRGQALSLACRYFNNVFPSGLFAVLVGTFPLILAGPDGCLTFPSGRCDGQQEIQAQFLRQKGTQAGSQYHGCPEHSQVCTKY